jgi:hypothetical protein
MKIKKSVNKTEAPTGLINQNTTSSVAFPTVYNNNAITDPASKNEPFNEITKDFEVKLWSLINEIVKKSYKEIINNIQNEPYFSEQSTSSASVTDIINRHDYIRPIRMEVSSTGKLSTFSPTEKANYLEAVEIETMAAAVYNRSKKLRIKLQTANIPKVKKGAMTIDCKVGLEAKFLKGLRKRKVEILKK